MSKRRRKNYIPPEYLQLKPRQVHGQDNLTTYYYKDEILVKLKSIMEVETCPDTWDKDYIVEHLLIDGFVQVSRPPEFDVMCLACSVYGVNAYNRATNVQVANPVVGSFQKTIGDDCELIYLMRLGSGFYNFKRTIDLYAEQFASLDKGIDVGIMNALATIIFNAPNGKVATSIKELYDKIQAGEPAVFIDDSAGLSATDRTAITTLHAKENYVVDLLQIAKRRLWEELLTKIGINNANTDKRERLITSEVESNNEEVESDVSVFKRNVDECVKKVNAMFPEANLKIRFPFFESDNSQPLTTDGGKEGEEGNVD